MMNERFLRTYTWLFVGTHAATLLLLWETRNDAQRRFQYVYRELESIRGHGK